MTRRNYGEKQSDKPKLRNNILILCAGQTEKIYFEFLRKRFSNSKSTIANLNIQKAHQEHADPIMIVNKAIELLDKYDEIWCVFDKDEYVDFDEAISIAHTYSALECAFSNEAIEFWFLLHFRYTTGAINRKQLNEELSKNLGYKYDKDKKTIGKVCDDLYDKIEIAENNARKAYEYHKLYSGQKHSDWCSSSSVYALTKKMRKWCESE